MAAVLLTGAGFESQLGWPVGKRGQHGNRNAVKIENDPQLALLPHRNLNFEEALTELQNEVATTGGFGSPQRCKKLETAIVGVFSDMNCSIAQTSFSFLNETGWTIPEFLALFDAIFTPNQDLLLEKHYLTSSPVGLSLVSRAGTGTSVYYRGLTSCRVG